MFLTRGSPSWEGPSKQVMVIPAIYCARFPRNNEWVTEACVITEFENIEIRYLNWLRPMLRVVLGPSEDGCANNWGLFLNILLLSLREILRAVRRYLVSPLRHPCSWGVWLSVYCLDE